MPTIEESVRQLAAKVRDLKAHISTEEATKTALIAPFIQDVLGYDIFDPREVIPEYVADVGRKKGEKVDYAIKSGEDFRFLIECKTIGSPLSLDHATQLIRYFNVTDTEFAILTNGEVYHFYAQLDAANRMDEKPFMTLDLANIDERIFPHLEKCTKSKFDAETIAASAEHLKYVAEVRKAMAAEFREPSDDWVRYFANRVTSRRLTAQVLEFFREVVGTAGAQFIRDEANRRLRTAQDLDEHTPTEMESPSTEQAQPEPTLVQPEDDVETSPEEIEAFQIIKAIARQKVSAARIYMRDAKSYCAILFDDNNRKPIARLHFNSSNWRIGVFDEAKQETLHPLATLDDIYDHADAILARIAALAGE
ncbi:MULTISPECIES: type I restriction enzyme HsdR N-terminal domain-containing protein [unclassified Dietzia]|uniref:type I restriction enzyme HsdR N-terminal domain-containing protein n=1 Tax=unclassified Dietzia TaxID=2617939 RepID=UPI0015FBACE8|nr:MULTISPECIES: type I restriction enzyme HsdR N-terminal domain-containing protein [unclassified Dietzia]MBB1022899.1 restriction endonuclease [Dietzia sp. DQ12-76]MBB1028396.1 restriction endonuclease [Dietzia sp. DQ11-38-2]